jgi:DNA-binding HxlR family transcriptional regulator
MNQPRAGVVYDVFDPNCPSRTVLDLIGGRWTVLLIGALEDGPRRFGQLERAAAGISAKVLTQVLRSLERDGLVTRTLYAEVPPRTEYELTDLGRELTGPLRALREWAESHIEEIVDNRTSRDSGRRMTTAR